MSRLPVEFDSELLASFASACTCLSWLLFVQYLTSSGRITSQTARKFTHIGTGPLFILSWNFFPRSSPSSKYYAALIPLVVTARFTLLGLGVLKDEATVRILSRTGNRQEILKGPLSYGVIFVVTTLIHWGSPIGITSLMLLCAGDGFAGLIGARYGQHFLPWNNKKTWLGSFSFFVFSLLFSSPFIHWFNAWGWFSISLNEFFFPTLLVTVLVATLVESLPFQGDWDNVTVFLASAIALKIF